MFYLTSNPHLSIPPSRQLPYKIKVMTAILFNVYSTAYSLQLL